MENPIKVYEVEDFRVSEESPVLFDEVSGVTDLLESANPDQKPGCEITFRLKVYWMEKETYNKLPEAE